MLTCTVELEAGRACGSTDVVVVGVGAMKGTTTTPAAAGGAGLVFVEADIAAQRPAIVATTTITASIATAATSGGRRGGGDGAGTRSDCRVSRSRRVGESAHARADAAAGRISFSTQRNPKRRFLLSHSLWPSSRAIRIPPAEGERAPVSPSARIHLLVMALLTHAAVVHLQKFTVR
jgi:hypothetical protein